MNKRLLRSASFFPFTLASLTALALTIAAPSVIPAETIDADQWDITADKMTRYEDPPSIIAEGNVILTKNRTVARKKQEGGPGDWSGLLEEDKKTKKEGEETKPETVTVTLTTIKSNWMAYDVDQGTVKSKGRVLIDVGDDQLEAEEGLVDLNRETGTFKNATIIRQEKDMHLEGKVIEKTGELTYHIEDGWIITCRLKEGETPPWSFAAAETDITDGGYAFLKHTTFRIKGVPVLYSPYMILPAKRKRATGLLFPAVSFSDRDGFGWEQPLFIDLSPSSDMTFYPYYMADRGIMGGLEFRYALDENDKGVFAANFLSDDLSDPGNPDSAEYYSDGNYTHTNQDRYWVRGKVDQKFGAWNSRLDIDVVSDRDYLIEFTSGLTGYTVSDERFQEVFGRGFDDKTSALRTNMARMQRSWGSMSLDSQVLAYNDVRQDFLKDSTASPLWKLPAVDFTGIMPIGDSSFDLSWNADYVNYWRDNGIGAQRLDLFPVVSAPVPLSSYLESSVSFGLRNTSYLIKDYSDTVTVTDTSTDEDTSAAEEEATSLDAAELEWQDGDTKNRFLVDLTAETGTTMMRDFALNSGSISGWNHVFRPYMEYRFVPDTDDEIELPQFDSVDRIGDKNIIGYGLNNFFNIFEGSSGSEFSREIANLRIYNGYDLRSKASDEPLIPINVRMRLTPVDNFDLFYETDIDVYGDGVISHSVLGEFRDNRGDSISLDYRFNEKYNFNSIWTQAKINLFHNLTAGYAIERSIEYEKTVEEKMALIYQPSCWSVELGSYYTPGDHTIMVIFTLANLGSPLGLDMPGF